MGPRCLLFLSAVLPQLLAALPAADAETTTCRIEDCPNFRSIRYYEELGCVSSDGSSDCCPSRFNCSSLLSADKTKCHYKGKAYKLGDETGDERHYNCLPNCICINDTEEIKGGEGRFYCPGYNCPILRFPQDPDSICYERTTLDACCPIGIRCVNDSESSRGLSQCPYKGKTYWEDQEMFETAYQCKDCVCQKGFDGTLDGPWCKRRSCEYFLNFRVSVLSKCAPIFREDLNCCASRFHCPSAEDRVVRHSESATESEGDQCTYGEHTLKIGDEILVGNNGCVKCKCHVPPFVTCTRSKAPECKVYSTLG